MANIWLVVFIAVFAAPIDALTSEVSNRTQNERQTRSTDCPSKAFNENFLLSKLPEGLFDQTTKKLVFICQGDFYSTLFDENSMNAILSAYKITWENALDIGKYTVRTNQWKANGVYNKATYEYLYAQANKNKMDRGHLNPFAINSFHQDYAKSTFVYTNAVPQYSEWNRGAWKDYEKAIRRYTQLTCGCKYRGTMYLMTGTSDINFDLSGGYPKYGKSLQNYIQPKPGGPHIGIPNSLWTAGCCVWNDGSKWMAESIAVIGNNKPDPGEDQTTGMNLKILETLLGKDVALFPHTNCRDNSVQITVQYVDD